MSKITTHILDTSKGCPAGGVRVTLYRMAGPAGIEEKGELGAREEALRRDLVSSGESMKWNEAFEIASGTTNKDGRIADWRGTGVGPDAGADEGGAGDANMTADAGDVDMAVGAGAAGADATAGGGAARADATVGKGIYKIRFETRDYFDKQTVPSFYPFVDIYFEVTRDGHYHIPLLISPFGYSTYRGS